MRKRKLRLANPKFINFVEPKSVAIVGASTTPGKLGYVVVENLFNIGYKGKIYPVNPKGGELLGLKIFENVKKIPEVVDVANILIPATAVPDVVKDLAEMGVKNVVISSGGFTEVDEEGAKMQNEIVKTAKEAGMRIIGPNTTGVISAPANFSTTFTSVDELRVGGASYVSQTGNFGSVTLTWIMTREHFGISRVIGLGNKCDIDDADALEFLGEDPKTKVIGMYIEGLKDGRRFIETGKKAVKRKPVLVLKSGRTKAGAKAAASHTASLAADDAIVDSALRQSGVIRVDNYGDLVNYAKAFIFQPPPKGNRVG
ncbi:MAG: CoA-binding protein, partial [Candidatus Bathyarchaeota archaeon]|nr:CoA-binding protein [Candidatus Bathyarchaeota archaeon]